MFNTDIIGIDPGKNGALVCISPDDSPIETYVMPAIGKEFDIQGLNQLLLKFDPENSHVFIENVHAIHGSAAGATFTFGCVFGAIQALICAHKFPYTLVQPKAWQKVVYQGIPEMRKPSSINKNGKTVRGRVDTKKMSLLAAKRLFPDVNLMRTERCTKPHDGIVDALLIAEYGRRELKC